VLAQLAAMGRRGAHDAQLRDELETHTHLAAEDLMRQGVSPQEAWRRARAAIGGQDAAMEAHRDARSLPFLTHARQDASYAFRSFRRAPGVSLLAILILALGIGANTAVFSIVNPLLLRPLPLADSERLAWIENTSSGSMSGRTYRVDWYEEFARHTTSFEEMGAYFAFSDFLTRTLTVEGAATRLSSVDVAPGFFQLLGIEPQTGRLFSDDEHQGPALRGALLTHGFWQRRFGGDPTIVGRTIAINNAAVPVIGVMPASFDFGSIFTPGTSVDIFLPADLNQMRPWGNTLALVGKLRAGVSAGQAQREFDTLLPSLYEAQPQWGRPGVNVTALSDKVAAPVRQSLLVLWAAVGFVLLIVCANVTNLLLVRASSRRREFAVRGALGADRGRLFRQVLTEGLMLAGAGALLGLPLAYGLTMWLTSSTGVSVPLLAYAHVDLAALGVTVAIATITGIVGSVVPAIRLSGQAPQAALTEQGRGSVDSAKQTWIRRTLVVAEVALAAVLLVGAGLLGRSFLALINVELGFDADQALAASIDLPDDLNGPQQVDLTRRILERVQTLPGVAAAGVTDALPLDRNRTWGIGIPGRTYEPGELPSTYVYVVSRGYFPAMGIAIRAGREHMFDDPLTDRLPVVLNRTLATTLYPDEDPIGRPAVTGGRPLTIVGVVDDVRQAALDEGPVNQMYLGVSGAAGLASELILRATVSPDTLTAPLRAALREVDSRLLLTEVRGVESLVTRAVSPRRFLVELISGFSVFALLLACLGIYGVVSYHVGQRTSEIGVRMALGATSGTVRRDIVTDTLLLALIGVAVGGGVAWLLSDALRSLLYATPSTDPWVFGGTALALLLVAAVAGLIPAIRASRIDPATALRGE
jgi:predicted permease